MRTVHAHREALIQAKRQVARELEAHRQILIRERNQRKNLKPRVPHTRKEDLPQMLHREEFERVRQQLKMHKVALAQFGGLAAFVALAEKFTRFLR